MSENEQDVVEDVTPDQQAAGEPLADDASDESEENPVAESEADDDPDADAPASITADGPVNVRHRKAPKVGRFVAFGLLLGGIVSFVLAITTRGNSAVTMSDSFWLILLWLGPTGMGLGLLTAYILDRRSIAAMDRQTSPSAPLPEPIDKD